LKLPGLIALSNALAFCAPDLKKKVGNSGIIIAFPSKISRLAFEGKESLAIAGDARLCTRGDWLGAAGTLGGSEVTVRTDSPPEGADSPERCAESFFSSEGPAASASRVAGIGSERGGSTPA